MTETDVNDAGKLARELCERDNCDVYLYNGEMSRGNDLTFISRVHEKKSRDNCRLVLITPGGDPDAAYKIARYLQEKYRKGIIELIVSGLCKSAGTLVALGAHRLAFTPYGELGPLDVQIFKEDKLSAMQSGLNISEALKSMEKSALKTYVELIGRIVKSSGGVVSFPTASKAASDVLAALYSPIFGQIDPEDVGGRTRSMRIAADYGKRLDVLAKNMKPQAIERLAETYSSHSFVIDKMEATGLFKNVRDTDPLENRLVEAMGDLSRWPVKDAIIDCISALDDIDDIGEANEANPDDLPPSADGADRANSAGAGGAAQSESGRVRPRRPRRSSPPRLRTVESERAG